MGVSKYSTWYTSQSWEKWCAAKTLHEWENKIMGTTVLQWFSVCYESGSEKTQPEIQFCKFCQNIGLVEICSFRRELMAGTLPVLPGVFHHCGVTCTQIRDLISNPRQWVLLRVSPAVLLLYGSIKQMGWLMHPSTVVPTAASLVQRVLLVILSHANVHQHCYNPRNYKSEHWAHLKGEESIHKRLLLLGTVLGRENRYLCAVPPKNHHH